MYMHTLKQALFVLQGNTRSFNAMVLEQQQLLWEASNSGSRGMFESIATELRGGEIVKCVPVRIFYKENNCRGNRDEIVDKCNSPNITKEGMSLNIHKNDHTISCTQKPVHIHQSQCNGRETLLQDVLQQFLPDVFPIDFISSESLSILIQGINVPLTSPIMQLWKTCAHADFFLYIVVSAK